MNCSRCATQLADGATFCPRCGQSTTSSSSPSRTFSYLPAGAPSWPTSVPAQIPYVVDSKATTVSVAPPVVNTSNPLRKGLPLIVALVLIPLLGAAATLGILASNGRLGNTHATTAPRAINTTSTPIAQQTPTTQQTPTALPEATFKDTEASINNALKASLKYPTDWQLGPIDSSTTNVVTLPLVSQQIGIDIVFQRFDGAATDTPADINQARLQSLNQKYGSVQPVQSQEPTPTIGGSKWDQSEATFDATLNSQPVKVHYTTIAVKHANAYYSVEILTQENIYQEASTKYLKPILASFKFL